MVNNRLANNVSLVTKHKLMLFYQIGQMGGLDKLSEMFINATTNDERISSANALWILLFDKDNQKIFKEIDRAITTFNEQKVCSLMIIF